jgi:DnaD/phage-associated family protein
MAWIESHQSLSRHRKTMRVVALLKVDRHRLIGHLHELWWWALDSATPDGLLAGGTAEEIALGAGWPEKDAERFLDALVTAGFVDLSPSGPVLHNWYQYAGKLLGRRAANRDRMKDARAGAVRRTDDAREQHAGSTWDARAVATQPTNQPTNPTNQPAAAAGGREDETRTVMDAWLSATGYTATAQQAEFMESDVQRYTLPVVLDAIEETALGTAKNWKYVRAILDRWHREGRGKKESQGGRNANGRAAIDYDDNAVVRAARAAGTLRYSE